MVADGHDAEAIDAALSAARGQGSKPSLICCRTIIGHGAPTKAGHHDTHGAPLGAEEIARTREAMQWRHAPFEIPADVYAGVERARARREARSEVARHVRTTTRRPIRSSRASSRAGSPGSCRRISTPSPRRRSRRRPRSGTCSPRARRARTRSPRFAPRLPELIGGSADLTHSNLTAHAGSDRR